MNYDIYIFMQREVAQFGSNAGPWSQCDVQGEDAPTDKLGAAILLEKLVDNATYETEFQVLLIDDGGYSEVTLSIQAMVERWKENAESERREEEEHGAGEKLGWEQV